MILIWRGWGLLAVVALFPLLASCGGLITVEPRWIFMLAASLSLLLAGAVCVYCGTRWNRTGVEHSLYFVPLEVWGWVYLAAVGLFALAAIIGAVKHGLDNPQGLYQGIAGGAGLVAVVAAGVVLRRWSTRPVADRAGTDRVSEQGAPWQHPNADPGTAANWRDTGNTARGNRLAKYAAAICASTVGTVASLVAAWWAAHQWDNFSDNVIYGTWILPLLLYFFAFWLIARRTGEWPVAYRHVRFINSSILGVQCAALGYLSFVLVSFTWNERVLPPEKASIPHLIFHPSDIPPLKEIQDKWGKNPKEGTVTWHKGVFLGFAVGAFCGYVYSMGKGNTL